MAQFTRRMAERIMDATVKVERTARPLSGRRRKWPKQRPFTILLAKSASDVTKGASGTFTIYDTGSSETKGSETATARTKAAYARVGDYTANKWAYLVRFPNGWEVIQTECAT